MFQSSACRIASLCAAGFLAQPAFSEPLALEQLIEGRVQDLVMNQAFLPSDAQAPAHAEFNGTLLLGGGEMQMRPELADREVMGLDAQMFPGAVLEFFTHDGELVPVTQNVITPPAELAEDSFWQIIVQPGLVWSEPDDDGWSRASFPFALMNRLEQDTHNGVAIFAYRDDDVTPVRYQIVQQTAPYYIPEHFKAWGAVEAFYTPADSGYFDAARDAWRAELADRFETRPWDELPAEALEGFEGETSNEWVVMHALVNDDVIYYQPSHTEEGPYPFPTQMRFGVWSITKSVGPGVGMLRLAEKYGDWVFELKLVDYLDIDPPHDGWNHVTFGNALDMATGLGGETFHANPNNFYADYTFEGSYDDWYRARSEAEKVEWLDEVDNYPWGPGLVARYRDRDMFALGVAMDNFLKFMEGEDANIWRMIADEVFRPIGIYHAPMNMTFEEDGREGQPIMAWGWYPTLDDMAKLSRLLHDRGEHRGEQILHRERTEALFSIEDTLDQGPANAFEYGNLRYKMAFHYVPFEAGDGDEPTWLPFMRGYVGNNVVLAPNRMTAIRISKAWPAPDEAAAAVVNPTSMIEVMDRIRPFSGN